MLCHKVTNAPIDLCDTCFNQLPTLPAACIRCANILYSTHKTICWQCLKTPPTFDHAYAVYQYVPPISHMISHLKFNSHLVYAKLMGELLILAIKKWYLKRNLPKLLIPVPLHVQRLKIRGFNQALEIARPIAKSLALPIDWQSCKRIKPTLAQTTLNATYRKRNMNNAFFCEKPLEHQHVAIIDDVITTGSTIEAFSLVLKKSGIKTIDVWCFARA